MDILLVVLCVIAILTFALVMRYNLHMFQLNGYKNIEHVGWLKKNWHRQNILLITAIFSVALLIKTSWLVAIILCLVYFIDIKYYLYLKRNNSKKKLVYTKRVKRLVGTEVILNIGISVGVYCFGGLSYTVGSIGVLILVQPFILLLVNILNKPIELFITNYFINDAKKKLKKVPNLTTVGVTGSYGKTSVKYYLHTLLKEKYHVLITPESYNTPMGVVKTIRESLKSTHEIFVCEMGARHVGDIKEICDIVHPHHGVITSVGPQHLETFFNMDNIIKTKFELADSLPQEGMLFLNADNTYIYDNLTRYSNSIIYGTSENSGYYAEDIQLSQLGTEFVVVSPSGEKEKFQMRLIGAHNVINVVGAIAIANSMGISLKELRVPVRRIQPVEHRMQMLEKGNVTIIDDAYNSNPVGSKAAVETLAMFDGTRILITPGMVELGAQEEEFNYKFGTYAAKCCDYILLVGKKHTQPIRNGIEDSGFESEKCVTFDKLDDALIYAYNIKSEDHKYILLENDLPDNY